MASRHGRALFMLFEEDEKYSDRIRTVFGSHLIGYWPMNEETGTVIYDVSGNARNGAYNIITLNNAQSPNNRPSPLFTTRNANLYSTSLNSAFSGVEGCISMFLKVSEAGKWIEGGKTGFLFQADANNYIYCVIGGGDYQFVMVYRSGGTNKSYVMLLNNIGWFHMAITWSKVNDRAIFWINGVPVNTATTLVDWAGELSTGLASLGGYDLVTEIWNGWKSDVVLLDYEPTRAEMQKLAKPDSARLSCISILGDSISYYADGVLRWCYNVAGSAFGGWGSIINHAAAGASIEEQIAGQVTASATDDSTCIILALGRNDSNIVGNIAPTIAKVETAIDDLRISNPRASIYYLNVLPTWTDATGTTEVEMGNVRASIATACASRSVTCWDTYTDPWIDAADTVDGVHPTLDGHAKIAARVLALLL